MAETALDRAYLAVQGSGDRIPFMFNPSEVSVGKSAGWKDSQSKGAKKAPPKEFVGTNSRTLNFELFFDGWDNGEGDVSVHVEKLFELTCPTADSLSNNKPQPPLVVLHWGSKSYFEVYVKDVKAKYTMFDQHGVPIRAKVQVALEEVPQDPANQNPSSGGVTGRQSHRVVEGDSLPSIAYRYYRRPAYWRAIAAANAIEDPLRVRPGTTLLVPPAADATRMS